VAEILGLAVAAAFYPLLLGAVLLILTRPRPRPLLLAFLIGGMAVSLLAGTLILVLAQGSGALAGSSGRTVSPAVDIITGLVSLGVAVALWRRRRRPPKERRQPEWLSRRLGGSPWPAFVLGVALNLPGIYYLAALKQISVGGYGTATAAFLLLAFNLIMFALVEAPLAWYVISPEGARRRVAALDHWMHLHSTQLGAVIAAAAGAYLCAKGLGGALS
jgi:hypothetical protein